MHYDTETAVVTMNEQDVHDWLCNLSNIGGEHAAQIKLVIERASEFEPEFTEAHRAMWERRLNGLLSLMHMLDGDWHKVAEHTC